LKVLSNYIVYFTTYIVNVCLFILQYIDFLKSLYIIDIG